MSEGAAAVETKKRSRSRATKKKDDAHKPLIISDCFVCEYTGLQTRTAILPKACGGRAFMNIPCAVAWARANHTPEKADKIVAEIASEYNQPGDNILPAPPIDQLAPRGIGLSYQVWGEPIDMAKWDNHTLLFGTTVEAYQASLKPAKKAAKKKPEVQWVEAGMYEITAKGQIHALTGLEKDNKDDEGKPVGLSTPSKFARSVLTYFKKAEHGQRVAAGAVVPEHGCFVLGCHGGPEPVENELASRIAGSKVEGPAILLATKKFKIPNA